MGKRINAKDKAKELFDTHGSLAPFVVQEIQSNMNILNSENPVPKKMFDYWNEVNGEVMQHIIYTSTDID